MITLRDYLSKPSNFQVFTGLFDTGGKRRVRRTYAVIKAENITGLKVVFSNKDRYCWQKVYYSDHLDDPIADQILNHQIKKDLHNVVHQHHMIRFAESHTYRNNWWHS